MTQSKLFIFWDNSNIFIPAQTIAAQHEQFADIKAVRIHFENLLTLVRVGRTVGYGIAVGSLPRQMKAIWTRLREAGMNVETYERGADSGTEQGMDQCLQVHMLRVLADHNPAVAVLLTGDGKGYEDGVGFHADLERMHNKGWGIEVVSWDVACNRRLREWAKAVGVYVSLEYYYDNITFLKGGRKAKPIKRHNRGIAMPRAIS